MVDRTTEKYRAITKNAQQRMRDRRRQLFFDMKKELACVYCGYDNPLALEYDHIDPSSKCGNPANMQTNGTAMHKILEELEKCRPVCCNCHNIKTILDGRKLQGVDIEPYIPHNLKHLLGSRRDKYEL
jgi:5-methylcytosine-specific restriction endonuclease McrA